jgi:hypothetical protein
MLYLLGNLYIPEGMALLNLPTYDALWCLLHTIPYLRSGGLPLESAPTLDEECAMRSMALLSFGLRQGEDQVKQGLSFQAGHHW